MPSRADALLSPSFRTPNVKGISATSSPGCRTAISKRILKPLGRRASTFRAPSRTAKKPDIGSDNRARRRGKRTLAVAVARPETACR